MTYTINLNNDLNGIELIFASKPAAAILAAIKAQGFRWNNKKSLWYAKQSAERLTFAESLGEATTTETTGTEKKASKITLDKEMLIAEYSKAWKDPHMIKYCVDKLANVAILPNGDIISIDKQSIETRFCFGESGYDYDDAAKMAAHARTNTEYFKSENMKQFNEWINDLEAVQEHKSNYFILIKDTHYLGQKPDCRLKNIEWVRTVDLLDACGGSAYLDDIAGKHIDKLNGRIATSEEIKIILEAYKQARDAHEKKVDAYLKRYGLSKVDSWTYWREA